MNKPWATPVFEAINGSTHATEEGARESSRQYHVIAKMKGLLGVRADGFSSSDYERERAISWFIKNSNQILAAYKQATEYAEKQLEEEEIKRSV